MALGSKSSGPNMVGNGTLTESVRRLPAIASGHGAQRKNREERHARNRSLFVKRGYWHTPQSGRAKPNEPRAPARA